MKSQTLKWWWPSTLLLKIVTYFSYAIIIAPYKILKVFGAQFVSRKKSEKDLSNCQSGYAKLEANDKIISEINKLGKIPQNKLDAANAGDPNAQFFIGFNCSDIIGVDQAMIWIKRAANAGHKSAQSFLGMNYCHGGAINRDLFTGMKWLTLGVKENPHWQAKVTHKFIRLFMSRKSIADSEDQVKAWNLIRWVNQEDVAE